MLDACDYKFNYGLCPIEIFIWQSKKKTFKKVQIVYINDSKITKIKDFMKQHVVQTDDKIMLASHTNARGSKHTRYLINLPSYQQKSIFSFLKN